MLVLEVYTVLFCLFLCNYYANGNESHKPYTNMPSHVAMQTFLGESTKMLYLEKPWTVKKPRREHSGGISPPCKVLLDSFTNETSTYFRCIMNNARPLHYCENCVSEFTRAVNSFNAIVQPDVNTTSCKDELVRADNVQVVLLFYDFTVRVWDKSACHNCYDASVTNGTTIYRATEDTLEMLQRIQKVQDCFHDFGHSPHNLSICFLCQEFYKAANAYYSRLEELGLLCSDLEDAMNYTRRTWSKHLHCTIAVRTDAIICGMAAAICFIPVMFYLSTYVYGKRRVRRSLPSWRRSVRREEGNIEEREPMNLVRREDPGILMQTR